MRVTMQNACHYYASFKPLSISSKLPFLLPDVPTSGNTVAYKSAVPLYNDISRLYGHPPPVRTQESWLQDSGVLITFVHVPNNLF